MPHCKIPHTESMSRAELIDLCFLRAAVIKRLESDIADLRKNTVGPLKRQNKKMKTALNKIRTYFGHGYHVLDHSSDITTIIQDAWDEGGSR